MHTTRIIRVTFVTITLNYFGVVVEEDSSDEETKKKKKKTLQELKTKK